MMQPTATHREGAINAFLGILVCAHMLKRRETAPEDANFLSGRGVRACVVGRGRCLLTDCALVLSLSGSRFAHVPTSYVEMVGVLPTLLDPGPWAGAREYVLSTVLP